MPNSFPIAVIFRQKSSCYNNGYISSSLVYFVSHEGGRNIILCWLQCPWLLLWWLPLWCVMTQWCLSSDWDPAQTGPCWSPTSPSTSQHNNNLLTLQIRGKDLVGGVKVMPMGLDAAIKKRTSGEFKMEVRTQPQPVREKKTCSPYFPITKAEI